MPWYKLPHSDHLMWFEGERPGLEPADVPLPVAAEKPEAKLEDKAGIEAEAD